MAANYSTEEKMDLAELSQSNIELKALYDKIKSHFDALINALEKTTMSLHQKNCIFNVGLIINSINNSSKDSPTNLTHELQQLISPVSEMISVLISSPKSTEATELLNQISNLIESLREKISSLQEVFSQRLLTNFIAKNNSEKTKKLVQAEKYAAEVKNNIEKSKSEFNESIEEMRSSFEKLQSDLDSSQSEIDLAKENAKQSTNKIYELLKFTSNQVLINSHSEIALEERNAANLYRRLSFLFMIVVVCYVGYTLYELNVTDPFKLLLKFLFTIALSVPSAYLASESAKHRKQQHIHRQKAVDLLTVDPFIKGMNEQDQYKIKALVASHVFSNNDKDNSQNDTNAINYQQLIEKLIDKIDVTPKRASPD